MPPPAASPDLLGIERDLRVCEPQWGEAGGGERLVTAAIPGLLRRRSVIAEAVGLDDEAEIGPVEVDPEAMEPDLGPRLREAGAAGDRDEAALELGVGEKKGAAVEEATEGADR